MNLHEFIPKSWVYLRKGYEWALFKKDLVAGVTVGIIALPLAMAFAIASGVGPERGLYTAIVAGFLISAFGGSRIQIGGPTGAFVVVVYDIMQRTGYSGLCTSMLIASVLMVLFGLFRIGSWIKYIPYPLVVGFTTAIAVLICMTQVKDFIGWKGGSLDPLTCIVSLTTLGFILLIRKLLPRLPWGIAAIVFITLVCFLFDLKVDTVQSRFGQITRQLPTPSIPALAMPSREIFVDALTIALLGSIESLLSAVIGDRMIGGRHRSNCELVAQGIANFGSFLFGGIPATGAIARTAANIKTGGQTPVAGMIHAVTLAAILFFFAPVVSQIPLAGLSAVLVVVAWNMSELGHFIRLLKMSWQDRAILLSAFLLTVFVDITVAIGMSMTMASLFFMKQMSERSRVVSLRKEGEGVEVYEIEGPLFFGTTGLFKDTIQAGSKVLILRMPSACLVDASGLLALREFSDECKRKGLTLLVSDVHGAMRERLQKFGLVTAIGEENFFPDVDTALGAANRASSI